MEMKVESGKIIQTKDVSPSGMKIIWQEIKTEHQPGRIGQHILIGLQRIKHAPQDRDPGEQQYEGDRRDCDDA